MDTPRDPWLQAQIERYYDGNAASAAFYQQAAHLLAARQLLAAGAVSRRRRSLARLLRAAFGRWYRGGLRTSSQSLAVLEGVVAPAAIETDQSAQTVIVIGVQQTKGE
jgi:hypothetical protein